MLKALTRPLREELRRALAPAEPEVKALLRRNARRGTVCVDIGAYVGEYTVVLARGVGRRGRVVAIEPVPANADRLEKRLRMRGLGRRVTVVRAAAAAESGTATLYPGRYNWGPEWSLFAAPPGSEPVGGDAPPLSVRSVALDDVLDHVDLVKIDAEGAEVQVLAGMQRLLRESRPLLVIETHGDERRAALADALEAAGYDALDTRGSRLDRMLSYHLQAVPRRTPA